MDTLYGEVVELLAGDAPFTLATVVHASGSTPQKAGAKAIFLPDGRIVGTLGGGCMEAESRRRGLDLIRSGESLLYDLHLDDDFGWDDGLICGGTAQIFLQPMRRVRPEPFAEALSLLGEGGRGVLVTVVAAPDPEAVGTTLLVREPVAALTPQPPLPILGEGESSRPTGSPLPELGEGLGVRAGLPQSPLHAAAVEAALGVLRDEREGPCRIVLPGDLGTIYIEPILPRPTLLIAGAGHVGAALAHYGARLGFKVVVVDDRPAWANRERLPDADEVLVEEIVGAVRRWPKTPQTYVVIVTRGHRNDAVVLREVIHAPVAYIGMIGSRRKVLTIYEEFVAEGIATAEQLARVHAPIGLDIGALSVDEIAVSIAAELVLVRRRTGADGTTDGTPGRGAAPRASQEKAPSASATSDKVANEVHPRSSRTSEASLRPIQSANESGATYDHGDRTGGGGVAANGTAQGALAVREAERDRHGRPLARTLPDRRDPGRRRPPRECAG
jgi:xanthine dehydrogenase accessory factor